MVDRPRWLTLRVTRPDEGTLRVHVIDNGAGIHKDDLVRIFAHGFTTRKGGRGFGLHSFVLAA